MKINGKDLKDIIKDGVMNIVGDINSIKVKNKGSSTFIQNGNVVGGDMVGGNFTQIVNGRVVSSSSQQRVFIDGEEIPSDIAQGIREINITGNVGSVDSNGNVHVGGDCNGAIDSNGNVEIRGSVKGNIDSNGRVTCGDVTGDIDSNGRVECGNVGGDVEAMGSVSIKK